MQCQERTKSGNRCKAAAMKGKRTCLFHTTQRVKKITKINRSFTRRHRK